ncbi:MAG: DMT family transporter [Thermomicrobiales bacterium]
MSEALAIAITVILGITQALQVALLGAMNRVRGPSEAAYLSILGTVAGLSLALAVRGFAGSRVALPFPFDMPVFTGVIAIASGALLFLIIRGLPGGYVITGLLAVPYLIAASYLAPKIGVGLFVASLITGQMIGGVLLDQIGAFGAEVRPVDVTRLIGVAALIGGVVLVRGIR